MALFRRNKSDETGMPEEVTSYYEAENRERTWMAWLLALVTLAITAVVIIGLFFGGRWTYRKLRHSPNTKTPAVVQKPATEPTNTATPTTDSTPSSSSSTPSSSNGSVNAPTNPAPAPAASTPAASSAAVAPATTSLPNTGPGNTLEIFAAVSVLAYFLHRRLQRQ